jgi:antitoxin component of RelBE/YafQ-DinJ toxin-antitoxin module
MNTKTTLTIKTDKKLRDQAKKMAARLGIPLTTVINARLAEFVRDGHFEVSLTPLPEKIAEWKADIADMEAHPENYKTYHSASELMADINKMRGSDKKKRSHDRTTS